MFKFLIAPCGVPPIPSACGSGTSPHLGRRVRPPQSTFSRLTFLFSLPLSLRYRPPMTAPMTATTLTHTPRIPRGVWRSLTRFHRWAGLILGVQILLWFASGLFMALAPIELVRGTHLRADIASDVVLADVDFAAVADAHAKPFTSLEVYRIADRTVVTLDGTHHRDRLGQPLTPLPETFIRDIATTSHTKAAPLAALTLLDENSLDYRGPLPVWQARFADSARTRFYIDPTTGDIRNVRTRLWRVFDTMWMLHIMDYSDRTNFNTWWLRLFAAAATLFALSGLALVTHRMALRPKRVR